jgi:hypothetical protein
MVLQFPANIRGEWKYFQRITLAPPQHPHRGARIAWISRSAQPYTPSSSTSLVPMKLRQACNSLDRRSSGAGSTYAAATPILPCIAIYLCSILLTVSATAGEKKLESTAASLNFYEDAKMTPISSCPSPRQLLSTTLQLGRRRHARCRHHRPNHPGHHLLRHLRSL